MSSFRRRLLLAASALIHSCFGNGFWDNNACWDNNEGWNN